MACVYGCGRQKIVRKYCIQQYVWKNSFLPGSRGIFLRASQFCNLLCTPVSVLPEVRGLVKLRAVLVLLVPVTNAAVSVSLSNASWSPDIVQQQPVSSLVKLARCHLLKTVSSYKCSTIKYGELCIIHTGIKSEAYKYV